MLYYTILYYIYTISGWMQDDSEDYKRAFGVIPTLMTMTERLNRYYTLYDKNRLKLVNFESEAYEDDSINFYKHLKDKYNNHDPLNINDLTVPLHVPPLKASYKVFLEKIIQYILLRKRGLTPTSPTDGDGVVSSSGERGRGESNRSSGSNDKVAGGRGSEGDGVNGGTKTPSKDSNQTTAVSASNLDYYEDYYREQYSDDDEEEGDEAGGGLGDECPQNYLNGGVWEVYGYLKLPYSRRNADRGSKRRSTGSHAKGGIGAAGKYSTIGGRFSLGQQQSARGVDELGPPLELPDSSRSTTPKARVISDTGMKDDGCIVTMAQLPLQKSRSLHSSSPQKGPTPSRSLTPRGGIALDRSKSLHDTPDEENNGDDDAEQEQQPQKEQSVKTNPNTPKTHRKNSDPLQPPYPAPTTAPPPVNPDETPTYWNWNELDLSCVYELYLLRWETTLQRRLGSQIKKFLVDLQISAIQKVLTTVFFTTLASAVVLPAAILRATNMIDGLWGLAIIRTGLSPYFTLHNYDLYRTNNNSICMV